MSKKKKAATPKLPSLQELSDARSERMHFRASPKFKEALRRIQEVQKASNSWYDRKASEADVIEKAVMLHALSLKQITKDDLPYRIKPE